MRTRTEVADEMESLEETIQALSNQIRPWRDKEHQMREEIRRKCIPPTRAEFEAGLWQAPTAAEMAPFDQFKQRMFREVGELENRRRECTTTMNELRKEMAAIQTFEAKLQPDLF